jgi:predicted RNase H-like nuclease (RuvC/YqgF family)
MIAVLEKLTNNIERRRKAAEADYWKIVRALADGKETDVERVEHVLNLLNRTTKDLEANVRLFTERAALKARVDRGPAIEKEIAVLDRQVESANAKLREAELEHEQRVVPLINRRRELGAEDLEIRNTLSHRLVETCPYEHLKRELTENQEAVRQCDDERRELAERIAHVSDLAVAANREAEGFGENHPRRVEHAADCKKYGARVVELRKQLAEADQKLSELIRKQDEIRALMMEP